AGRRRLARGRHGLAPRAGGLAPRAGGFARRGGLSGGFGLSRAAVAGGSHCSLTRSSWTDDDSRSPTLIEHVFVDDSRSLTFHRTCVCKPERRQGYIERAPVARFAVAWGRCTRAAERRIMRSRAGARLRRAPAV